MIKNVTSAMLATFLAMAGLIGCGGQVTEVPINGANSNAALVSLSVTPTNSAIAVGTSQDFTAVGNYSDGTTRDLTASVTWSSSDTTIADISDPTMIVAAASTSPGRIKVNGKRVGQTTISASSGSTSGSATITVTPATLVSIAVSPTNPSIARGTAHQFTATGTFSDNTTQDLTTAVTWSSSNTAAATISNTAGFNGLAASVAAGSATIAATSGSISGSTTLTVSPATLVSLAVTPVNANIALGTGQQLIATGTFSDNSTQNLTAAVTWSSSNTAAAAVSNAAGFNGLASSVAAGSTTITATSGNIAGSTTLTVTPATLVSLAVTPTNPSIAKGTTRQFTATGTYSDGTTQNLTAAVAWSSSNTAAATVSNAAGSNGLATSIAVGSTTITATSGNIAGSTTLTITAATLVSLAVTPANPSIAKGTTRQFTATGTYSDGTTQNLTAAVTWSSSSTAIATINNAAGSNGLATAVAAGSTTIRAASGSVSGTAALSVTANSTVTLTWNAPTTRIDGSSLDPATDLSAYKIYYGTTPQMYTQTVTIANPGTTTISQTLTLAPGTYYFVVTVIDNAGAESSYSNEASKTI